MAPAATHAATVPEFDVTMPALVAVGSSFNMTVALNTNTVPVTSWEFGFDYDPTLLQIATGVGSPPVVGTFSTFFSDQANLLGASTSNVNFKLTQDGITTSPGHVQPGGQVLLGQGQGQGIVGTSSSIVMTFTFTGLANGVAPITFHNLVMTDVNALSIPGITVNPATPSITVGSTPPKARADAAWGYDPGSGKMVLFGGFTNGAVALGDTWTFAGTWARRNPTAPPGARDGAQFVSNSALNALFMYGSRQGNTDTWTYHNGVWTKLQPTHNPGARDDMGLGYDSRASRVVLFGGGTSAATQSDTWLFDGTDWSQALPATSPPGRSQAGMAYDTAASQTVLFGGFANGTQALGDTWTWNGTAWRQRTTPAGLTTRGGVAMAYDPVHKNVVLFGGFNQQTGVNSTDTWLWNGTAWSQAQPTSSPPTSSSYRARLAYDPAKQLVLLFGGNLSNAVWGWDGSNWTRQ
jgi:hypothetical protein